MALTLTRRQLTNDLTEVGGTGPKYIKIYCCQSFNVELISANNMPISLVDFVKGLCDKFSDIEKEAKQLSIFVNQEYSSSGKRNITHKFPDKEVQVDRLSATNNFRINTYNVIIDKLVAELQKRREAL